MAPSAMTRTGRRPSGTRRHAGAPGRAGVAAVLGLLLGATACGTSPPGPAGPTPSSSAVGPDARREQARELWAARGPAHYRFVWSTSAMIGRTRVLVEVGDHHVVRTTVLPGDRRPADRAGRTVEDLFRELAVAQREADAVTVAYDPTLGYPTRVEVDQERNAIDDEHAFAIEDLRPV